MITKNKKCKKKKVIKVYKDKANIKKVQIKILPKVGLLLYLYKLIYQKMVHQYLINFHHIFRLIWEVRLGNHPKKMYITFYKIT